MTVRCRAKKIVSFQVHLFIYNYCAVPQKNESEKCEEYLVEYLELTERTKLGDGQWS